MKRASIIAILVWSGIFAGLWFWSSKSPRNDGISALQKVYGDKLQTAFFAGFLTMAGFILSLKTTILLRLQKDLFEDAIYKERVKNAIALDGKPRLRNAPLILLGKFLIWTVLICLGASLTQITIGLISADWAVAICFATVGSAVVFIFYSWKSIRANLCLWFEILEQKENEEKP
jgi:hypothetical protein